MFRRDRRPTNRETGAAVESSAHSLIITDRGMKMIGWWDVMSNASGNVGYFFGSIDDDLHVIVPQLPDGAQTIGARHILDAGSGVEVATPTIYRGNDDQV